MKKTLKFFAITLTVGILTVAGFSFVRAANTPSAEVYTNGGTAGPTIVSTTANPTSVALAGSVVISVKATDVSGVSVSTANIRRQGGGTVSIVQLYDDGKHNDGTAGDDVYANTWNVGANGNGTYPVDIQLADALGNPTVSTAAVTIIVGTGNSNANYNVNTSSGNTNNANANANANTNTANTNNANANANANTNTANTNTADTTVPTVSITTPATDGAALSTASYSVVANAVDAESLINRVEFFIDAETTPRDTQNFDQPSGSHNYTWVLNVGALTTGSHTLKAIAYNGAALTATATRTVNVTYTSSAPTNVSITSPTSGTFASTDAINVLVHAEDDADIARIEIYSSAGGGAVGTATLSGAADTNVNQTITITAGNIAYVTGTAKVAGANWPRLKLPFISTAEAATGDTCTTTTTPRSKTIYALAYDASSSTASGYITYTVNFTTTTCTSTNSTTGSSSPTM